MLLVLPTSAMTEKASEWLTSESLAHQVIPLPESINYKTGSDIAIYIDSADNMDAPMRLSRARFVVMRVFRDFDLKENLSESSEKGIE